MIYVTWRVPRLACPRRLCQPPWTHSSLPETDRTHRRNQLCRSNPAKRQPLFGREREGGASLREAASLAYLYVCPSLRERGSGGEALLFREAASPPESPSLFHCFCEIVEGGFVELGAAEGDSWLNDGDFLHLGQHALHGPHRRRAPRAVFDQAEGALLIVLDK